MGSDWTAPPIPTPAALVGLGEDEYEILSHIAQKMTHGALKEKKKAAAGAIPAAEEEKDRDFFAVLGASIVKMVRGLPAWFVKNWIPLAVMFGVWVLIQLVLANLLNIGFVKMVVFFLGALTASFGNFLGKTVFAVFLFGTALPLYRYYKQSGAKDLFAKYRKVRQMLRHALEGLGKRAWKVVPARPPASASSSRTS